MKIITSIIIPTLKRKRSVLRLLNSLLPQLNDQIEIIIVEQGENNGSSFLKYAKKNHITIVYIHNSMKNTAQAKNIGAQNARGIYLIFFDDDVIVHEGILINILKNFSDPDIGCVAGRAIVLDKEDEPNNQLVGRMSPWCSFSEGFSSKIRQYVDTPVGCNMAFPRYVFQLSYGFDENYTGAIREESDLALRIKNLGYKIVFDPYSSVTHLREPNGGGRKTEGRIQWYFHYFSNEMYFFLKHGSYLYFPLFLITRSELMLRCMFGFGREFSIRSMVIPLLGLSDGVRKYLVNHEHRS